ncbi:WD40 repeat domain-containing serine/threonine protein kinase [Tautonia plasticadhaerens]|uniref:Serine/threonine-protein kinase PrkC n=1 Tax=Tautonia plasticadhaerens TaxID=2527974 RepID=A0A518GUU9_9BACT|nr:protein kinase [Tautonia plasticadhaerens]QDV32359.1 Serine/threonine-protein kinase PrkC [Tautonia plasticadhaerens]
MTGDRTDGRPAGDDRPGDDPLADWLADYDEALLLGDTLPDDTPEPGDPEQERLRDLLHLLDQALRPSRVAPGPASPLTGETPEDVAGGYPPLGRFVIERELGRGGFGVVYRAYDPEMDRVVALKLPRADALLTPGVRRRFLREARTAARLDHPNLVPVFEAGQVGPICYIASAYCEGPDLGRWLREQPGPLDPRQAARLARVLAEAVAHIHTRGLLHCDLKPGNVLIDPPRSPGGDPVPRLTDFGLARLLEAAPGASITARPMGTPPYMAPELIEARPDAAGPPADVYALGAVLFELLAGRPPHTAGTPWTLMRAVLEVPPRSLRKDRPEIPRDLEAVCLRCLEKRPEVRYGSARDLADDLGRVLAGEPTEARPLGRAHRAARWSARHPARAALIGLGLVTLVLSLGSAIALSRSNARLGRSRAEAQRALEGERHLRYVATIALAQEDARRGRVEVAQQRLGQLVPTPGEADLRDFAWHFLDRRLRADRTVLGVLPGLVEHAAVGARGDVLANTRGVVRRWRLEPVAGGRPRVRELPPPDLGGLYTWAVGPISPDGALAVLNVDDRLLDDLDRWRAVASPPLDVEPKPVPARREALALLDLADGRVELVEVEDLEVAIPGAFSPDGSTLVVSRRDEDRGVPLIESRPVTLASGRRLALVLVREARALIMRPDGRCIATILPGERPTDGSQPREFVIFDALPAGGHRRLPLAEGAFLAASPDPGGPIVTTTDGDLEFRDGDTGEVVRTVSWSGDRVNGLAVSGDGTLLFASDDARRAALIDPGTGTPSRALDGLSGPVSAASFLTGEPGLVLGLGNGQVLLWHPRPLPELPQPRGHADEAWDVAFSNDGRLLASFGGDGLVKLWERRTGTLVKALEGHRGWSSCLAMAPGTRRLASADFDGRVLAWDLDTGRVEREFRGHDARVRDLAFSPDGEILAGGGDLGEVVLWDAATGSERGRLEGDGAKIRGLAFRPDGRVLAVADDVARVRLWDVREGRRLGSFAAGSTTSATSAVTCVSFSPDGRTLAAGDNLGSVILWDAASGRELVRRPLLHAEEVCDVAYSPDGRVLASAGQDGVVTLLDVATGEAHLSLTGHERGVNAVAFSPDGRTLASASHDGSVRLWWAGPGEPFDRARAD